MSTLPFPLAIRDGRALARRCHKSSGDIRFIPFVLYALAVRNRPSASPALHSDHARRSPFCRSHHPCPFRPRQPLLYLPPRRPRWRGRRRRPLRPQRHPSLFSNLYSFHLPLIVVSAPSSPLPSPSIGPSSSTSLPVALSPSCHQSVGHR